MNLSEKFVRLKKQVPGNREKVHYEESFAQPVEEWNRITPLSKWNQRILSEVEFAIRLSEVNGGKYDAAANEAMDILQGHLDRDGVLTIDACKEAEEKLLCCAADAKAYELILVAHAHIDMNWMWGWQETVAATLSTFRTMLHIMDEYPDFCFSQSQTSVYKIVEDYDPDMMQEIKQRIKEGRWEITASEWVETDKNMPNTESLLRHIKYTREYLRDHWEIDPASLEIDFSPDTFGHSANIPEIDTYGDVKYMYHCRGRNPSSECLYRWQSPSGKELLCYQEQYWYNSGITPFAGLGIFNLSKRSGGLKTGLIVYGVGNHGGGPTRRDVEKAIELNEWPVFPKFTFGTLHQFFEKAESVRENLSIEKRELNFFSPGCYTTQSRIKRGNRRCEAALSDAEAWNVLADVKVGAPYYKDQYRHAWQNVLFTHFHDILTGSCVQESREHAMGLYADAMAVANTQYSNATRMLSEQIDTSMIEVDTDIADTQSEGAGVGYGIEAYAGVPSPERGVGKVRIFHVFNPTPRTRKQLVELTVFDWVGDLRYIKMADEKGNPVDFQLLTGDYQHYWSHRFIKLAAEVTVPGLGYATLVMSEGERDEYAQYFQPDQQVNLPVSNFVLENEYIRAEVDYQTGKMISYIDKSAGKELLRAEEGAGLQYIETERATSSAWQIGRYLNEEPVSHLSRIYPFQCGPVRQGVEMELRIKGSSIRLAYTLDRNAKAVACHIRADWNETGLGEYVPVLIYRLPLAYSPDQYLYDVPAGAQFRAPMDLDVPGLQYGAAVNPDGKSLAIVTDCKYGYRGVRDNLISTLINSANNPDPYPERGIHEINLYLALSDATPKAMEELATDCNRALSYQPAGSHKGSMAPTGSLLTLESGSSVLSGITKAEDGGLLVRVYETEGKTDTVQLKLGFPYKSAQTVSLEEKPNGGKVTGTDDTVSFTVEPYSIQTVKLL